MPALLMRMSSASTFRDGGLNVRRRSNVEHDRCHPRVRMREWPSGAGVDAARAAPQSLLDQRVARCLDSHP